MLLQNKYEGLIMDLGVSDGNDTAYYLTKGFQVIAVEADPIMCKHLRERFASEIASGSLRLINCAASNSFGEIIPIFAYKTHQGISGMEKRPDAGEDYEQFDVMTVDWITLQAQLGVPRYVKIDIEGNEEPFLSGMLQSAAAIPEFISVECYKFRPLELLRDLGYRRFKIVDQNPEGGFTLPIKQFEGKSIQKADFLHSSGPFGLDIFSSGEWLDWEQCIGAWGVAAQRMNTTWFDCHAWRL